MKIRPEAWIWVLGTAIPGGVFYGAWLYTDWYLDLGLFVLCAVLSVFFLYFFRDPDRTPESEDPRDWLAPADGIVTAVESLENGRTKLVIFLTVFNVHVNRVPIDCEIEEIEYREGRFLPAFKGELERENEQNRLRCRDERGRVFELRQIAGMLARRIYCWVEEGDRVERGERFGMIAVGSRTDLVLPEGVEPRVTPRQTVRGGRTVVATESASRSS